ncbi:Pyroglutamyl-peptidase I [Purpureocillium takamizusanense]|uniref:Pyroglutamyl-peptidase I n=1 Tax=Purpureocillium takamizusanense TaxID=2060973 RepID=A0A9Q8V785_9HYPO|nr:Pyroglutamyl-peptidase I [Purpureocillium takamizusanense]UNI14567.1 Pyroglutamyl-peptidase I [Purpureocillium takamizusanense]
MGSQAKDPNELTVLVTGFGPFREGYPINPSWEIAKGLPEHLPPLPVKDPSSRNTIAIPPVRILVHPEPIRVSYKVVREVVPTLWDGSKGLKIDFAIHIGMAGPQPVYKVERRGHRTGYKSPDVDGEKLEDEGEGGHGEDWIWHGLPDEIATELDLDDVLERWQGHSLKDMDLRVSEDAGHFLCDFIYYSSLATLLKEDRPRNVAFLHVPANASDKNIIQGRGIALNLIRGIAESQTARRAAAERA